MNPESKITSDELEEMFGYLGGIPMEVVQLIWSGDPNRTCGQVRAQVREVAERLKKEHGSLEQTPDKALDDAVNKLQQHYNNEKPVQDWLPERRCRCFPEGVAEHHLCLSGATYLTCTDKGDEWPHSIKNYREQKTGMATGGVVSGLGPKEDGVPTVLLPGDDLYQSMKERIEQSRRTEGYQPKDPGDSSNPPSGGSSITYPRR